MSTGRMGTPRAPMKIKTLEFENTRFTYDCERKELRVDALVRRDEGSPPTLGNCIIFTEQGVEELRAALRSISKPVDE